MTKKQYLWLFIWIFIFFLLFCIWKKLQYYTPNLLSAPTSKELQTKIVKNMHFKVIKKDDMVIISGIVPTLEEKNKIIHSYHKVFQKINADSLLIDKDVQPSNLLRFLGTFADNFSKFDAGYLAFSNGNLEIDGIAKDESVKETLQKQLNSLHHVSIDNRLYIKSQKAESSDEENSTKETITHKTAKEIQKEIDTLLSKKRVQFLYARDILTSGSKLLINEIASILKQDDRIKIEIAGHTDSDGTRKKNIRLSKRRADSVKKQLIKQGIKEQRMKSIGYGESIPIVPNNNKKNKEINRRVEFKVIGE